MNIRAFFTALVVAAAANFAAVYADELPKDSGICHCTKELISCEKTYVEPSQIGFFENKILIDMAGIIVHVPALHSDRSGFYFNTYFTGQDCGTGMIACPYSNCGECNAFWRSKCTRCGRRIR